MRTLLNDFFGWDFPLIVAEFSENSAAGSFLYGDTLVTYSSLKHIPLVISIIHKSGVIRNITINRPLYPDASFGCSFTAPYFNFFALFYKKPHLLGVRVNLNIDDDQTIDFAKEAVPSVDYNKPAFPSACCYVSVPVPYFWSRPFTFNYIFPDGKEYRLQVPWGFPDFRRLEETFANAGQGFCFNPYAFTRVVSTELFSHFFYFPPLDAFVSNIYTYQDYHCFYILNRKGLFRLRFNRHKGNYFVQRSLPGILESPYLLFHSSSNVYVAAYSKDGINVYELHWRGIPEWAFKKDTFKLVGYDSNGCINKCMRYFSDLKLTVTFDVSTDRFVCSVPWSEMESVLEISKEER